MKIRHTSAVEEEIVDGILFYLLEESPQSAERFEAAIQEAESEILSNPTLHPFVSRRVQAKYLDPFPFTMLYRVEEDEIVIVALAHQKRKTGYWKNRH